MDPALTVRRLQVDLDTPWPRHWTGGAFSSAWFNALSFSFPAGEQFFIDAVRLGQARLPADQRERLADELRGFVGQEATHRQVHQRFNRQLQAQGYVNHWDGRIRRRIAHQLMGADPRIRLGLTAATEHFTAFLADHLLGHLQILARAEPRLRDLWLWHASEETEHRSTAFDLYRALGGDERWRRRLYRAVTLQFVVDLTRQIAHNLWRDGHAWRPATWVDAARFLFGRDGVVRCCWRPWRHYFATGFHPSDGDGGIAARWLAEHATLAPPVQAPGSPGAA